jgi:YD repeat-containing protein
MHCNWKIWICILFTPGFISCDEIIHPDDDKSPLLLVTDIFDYDSNLISHFEYNDSNQLIWMTRLYDPANGSQCTMNFFYSNGLLSRICGCTNNYCYSYNEKGQINKIGVYTDGVCSCQLNLIYDSKGHLVSYGDGQIVRFEYDSRGNLYKTTYHLTDPDDGSSHIQVCDLEFDSMKRPSFGLDYLIGIDLMQGLTNHDWEQSLSSNNILSESCSGTYYTYEYNEYGYPSIISVWWAEYSHPIVMRLRYKQVSIEQN